MLKKCISVLSVLVIILSGVTAFADSIKMLYPLYNYPTWWNPEDYVWDDIAAQGNKISITAIINPNNGPGSAGDPNSDYVKGMTDLAAGGVDQIGYVSTKWGDRDIDDVKDDIKKYNDDYTDYGITGIFLDEVSKDLDPAILSYYQELHDYIKSDSETSLLDQVVLNHGTHAPEAYTAYADVNVVFEDTYSKWLSYTTNAYMSDYNPSQFAYLVYDTPTAAQMRNAIKKGLTNNIGWGFVTDDVFTNPWDQLPSYWIAEIDYMAFKNQPSQNDGLVAYYPFNGTVNDESGYARNGVVHGATLTTDRFGNPDSAFSFDGSSYIEINADGLPITERSVSLWFKADNVGTHPTLLGYGGGSECGTSFIMIINNADQWADVPGFEVQSHCRINGLHSAYDNEPTDKWYHWVVTTDTDGTSMFLNGIQIASNTNFITNTEIPVEGDMAFGSGVDPNGFAPYQDDNIGFFVGKLDDIRIYDRALSESEISSMLICDEEDPWMSISGTITHKSIPVCALVLANGQSMFTCDDNLGIYNLDVPIDGNCEITLYGFASGFAPFKSILKPWEAQDFDITMSRASLNSKEIDITFQTEPSTINPNWVRISGTVSYGSTHLCSMVLANGQKVFTCDDDVGSFDLEVPLDGNGEITLYSFCSGFTPYKQIIKP